MVDNSLATRFPNLFACARNRITMVSDYMIRNGNNILWSPIFRRHFSEEEEIQFFSLMEVSSQTFILENGQDSRVWTSSQDGSFTTSVLLSCIPQVFQGPFKAFGSLKLLIAWLHLGG